MRDKTATIKLRRIVLAGALIACSAARAQFAPTGATTLSVTIGAEAALRVATSTTALTPISAMFDALVGATDLTYKIRTTETAGAGTLTVKVTPDLRSAKEPWASAPRSAEADLTYTCAVAAPGTGCIGSQTASATTATTVATFGAGASSSTSGNAGSTKWSLTNGQIFEPGAYSSTVTYTISVI